MNMNQVQARQVLVDVASGMLDGSVNLIEGVRQICDLRFAIGDPNNELFFPVRAIESQTDSYPLGEMRLNCDEDYLALADGEMDDFLAEVRDELMQACRKIVRAFSTPRH